MGRALASLLLLLAAGLSLPAAADTYKWVDERGVVNYSNSPPAGVKSARPLPANERVSIVETDEATRAAAAMRAPSYYQEAMEREWLQRQKLMTAANAAKPAPCTPYDCSGYDDYRLSDAYPYAIPVFAAPRLRPFRVIPAPVNPNPPSRARLMQLQR